MERNAKKAYIKSAVALFTAAVTAICSLHVNVQEVQAARSTLRRIDEIASTGTYSILEIVPEARVSISSGDFSGEIPAGNIGYLIGGQEPFEKTGDYRDKRDIIAYLKETGSLEKITGSENVLSDSGKYREYLEDMIGDTSSVNHIASIGSGDTVSLNDIAMNRALSGNYVKTYRELSENGSLVAKKALEYIKGGDETAFVSANDGDFQPAFSYGGESEKYAVTFEALSGDEVNYRKYGYIVENSTPIGKYGDAWSTVSEEAAEGSDVYVKDGDVYIFAGTLSKNASTISVAAVPSLNGLSVETTEYTMSANMTSVELSANDAVSVILDSGRSGDEGKTEETVSSGAKDTGPGSNSSVSGGKASGSLNSVEEKVAESSEEAISEGSASEETVSDDVALVSENLTVPEDGAVDQERAYTFKTMETMGLKGTALDLDGGAELYILSFKYTEDALNSEPLYHVTGWSPSANGAYSLDETKGLVPDVSGKGTVKEADPSAEYIVYQFDKGNGVYSPTLSDGAAVMHERGAKVYQGGGWKNNEWFKQFVFDRTLEEEYKNLNITVKTVAASNVTESDISSADFIYIAASGVEFIKNAPAVSYGAGRDISANAASEILRLASLETKPIMVESTVLAGGDSVMKYLVSSLGAQDYEEAYGKFDGTAAVSVDMVADTDGTFVNKRVYIFTNLFDSGKNVVNKDFDTEIIANEGLTDVTAYIDYENDNFGRGLLSRISEATAIRHIIAYEDRIVKGVYRVLEIEPQDMTGELEGDSKKYIKMASSNVLEYDLYTETDKNGITTLYYVDHSVSYDLITQTVSEPDVRTEKKPLFATKGDIVLTQMSVQEFIGRVEDLNAEYDLIFIGADTSGMNTGFYDQDNVKKYGPVYNDSDMNGMIYTNIGDLHKIENHLFPGLPPQKAEKGGNKFRFSGTDILEADIDRLTDFADAELPIILSDKLLNVSKNDVAGSSEGTLDKNSNMYKAIKKLYEKKRKQYMFAVSDVIENNKKLKKYMEVARPQVELKESSDEGRVIDAKLGDDGKYYTEIKFEIIDSFASSSTKYKAEFYIDRNADGKFSSMERDTSAVNWHGEDTEDGRAVNLSKGDTYTVTRTFSDEQNGCVPWRIVVYQDGNDEKEKRRTNITGYTRIERPEKPTIEVLQLLTSLNTGYSSAVTETVNLEKAKRDNSTKLGRYLNDVNNNMAFNLNIRSIRSDVFINDLVPSHTVEDYRKYLEEYDLVICGFADCWSFGKQGYEEWNSLAAEALMEYIREGRSVLFSHDCTSYHSTNSDWGYEINKYVRDVVGMNRYGYQPDKFGTNTPIELMYKNDQYDKIYKPSTSDTGDTYDTDYRQGEVYHSLMRYTSDTYGYNRLNTLTSSADVNPNGNGNNATYNVTKVNDGQITKFPYVLDDEIEVTNTHAQYFQLNFNVDQDEDGMGDLVVWYCLGDALKDHKKVVTDNHNNLVKQRVYRNSKNDVRNNYFIYSVGNVTYTGQGHKDFSNISDEECELFINTLIAAYSSGTHSPELTIHSSRDISSSIKTTEILPFDTGLLEEDFQKEAGTDQNLYVKPEDYPDYGDGTQTEDGSLLTIYFLPEELNVNVEQSKTEVSFYVDDDANSSTLNYLLEEDKNGGNVSYGIYMTDVEPLQVVSVKQYIDDDSPGVELEARAMDETINVPLVHSGGTAAPTYQLDKLDGNTMYSVTFDLSQIIYRRKDKLSENGIPMAIHNLPRVHIVLHTRAVKFTQPDHKYNYASLKFARAQLFMLE